jgi:hypothetical protein
MLDCAHSKHSCNRLVGSLGLSLLARNHSPSWYPKENIDSYLRGSSTSSKPSFPDHHDSQRLLGNYRNRQVNPDVVGCGDGTDVDHMRYHQA